MGEGVSLVATGTSIGVGVFLCLLGVLFGRE